MIRLLLLLSALLTLTACQAAHNAHLITAGPPVSVLVLPPPAVSEPPATKGQPYRFATAAKVDVSTENYGDWMIEEHAHWRLDLLSVDATSLGVRFDRLWLPPGATLRVYSVAQPDQLKVYSATIGAEPKRVFSPTFPGDRLALELTVPLNQRSQIQLQIGEVFIGFR